MTNAFRQAGDDCIAILAHSRGCTVVVKWLCANLNRQHWSRITRVALVHPDVASSVLAELPTDFYRSKIAVFDTTWDFATTTSSTIGKIVESLRTSGRLLEDVEFPDTDAFDSDDEPSGLRTALAFLHLVQMGAVFCYSTADGICKGTRNIGNMVDTHARVYDSSHNSWLTKTEQLNVITTWLCTGDLANQYRYRHWKQVAGRTYGGKGYHFGDLTRSARRVMASKDTWKRTSGRSEGGDGYHFGDITRTIYRTWFKSGND